MIKILEQLESSQDIDIEALIDDFMSYYKEHDRHEYHEITLHILSTFINPGDGETVNIILSNIEAIRTAVKEKCECEANDNMAVCLRAKPPLFNCGFSSEISKCAEYKWLYRKLNKLHDHISLEASRIGDLRKHNSELQSRITELKRKEEDLSLNLETVQTVISAIEEKANQTEKKVKKTERKLEDAQREYITILGIFASIVLAFTGGIAFSTSVLRYMGDVSIYRLIGVTLIISFILINIIYILVWLIRDINNKDEVRPEFMKNVNRILIIAFICNAAVWFFHEERGFQLKEQIEEKTKIEQSFDAEKKSE